MGKKTLIRVDASSKIGMGHLMRCLALAEALRKQRIKSVFVIRRLSTEAHRMIKNEGFDTEVIPAKSSVEKDLFILTGLIKKHKPFLIIIDSYLIGSGYKKKVKKTGCILASISGLLHADFYSDIIINHNVGVNKKDYAGRARPDALLLLGTKYFLLRKEFRFLKKARMTVKKQDRIANLLITMGGADPNQEVLKILEGLRGLREKIFLKVVLGPAYKGAGGVKDFARRNFHDFKIYRKPANIERIMSSSDIAVSAGGVTSLELAYLGIPAIILAIAPNQIRNARALGENGAALFLGESKEVSGIRIREALEDLLLNRRERISMSLKGQSLIDGSGAYRVAECLKKIYEKN